MITVTLTEAEVSALLTLCDLELGTNEYARIRAWRQVETVQDKLLDVKPLLVPVRYYR